MVVQSILEVKSGDTLGTVREFLKAVMEKGVAETLLVPLEVPNPELVTPILVKEPSELDTANPLAPVMRVNAAAVLARMHRDDGVGRLGAVLRPCELRAAIELAKVGRVDIHRLVLIGVDCMGTYEGDAYCQIARASLREESCTDEMMRWTRQGPIAPYRLRNSCQMCEHFIAENADLAIGLIGYNVRERLLVEAREEYAEELDLKPGQANGREKAIARLATIRHHRREEALTQASKLIGDLSALCGLIAPCTACGECMEACPFCNTSAFMPKPAKEPHTDRVRNWPSGEGRMMRGRDMGIFGELVEMSRRAASCVACGMCESSCPRHVPLAAIQGVLGRRVQEEYNYVPGRSLEERLPWARDYEDRLGPFQEEYRFAKLV
ncbi:MAG: 4Fe-4S dicluster domain-containing protein [Chloroflexi bacterium]|nr:4Fe-4S dicluster domain-containing protein [Chloroflexota bacterium]